MPVPEEKTTSSRTFQRAVDHLLAIAPMLSWNRPRGSGRGRPSLASIVSQIALEKKVCRKTVWRWYLSFRTNGFRGLVHSRSDAGVSRYLRKHPEIELMIRARISRGRSALFIWKGLRLVLGSAAPSYGVVCQYMKRQRQQNEAGMASSRAARAA